MADWGRDLRGCRTTAGRLFARRLAQQYRYSSLGLLWAFAPSALTALVLIGGQRSHVIGPAGGVPAAFYGIFGLAMGQTFIEALMVMRSMFASHQQLLRRQNVPLEGLVVAALIDVGFKTLVRILTLGVVFFLFSVRPALATLPLAALGFAGVLFVGAGLGLLIAPISSLKRDIDNALAYLPWMLFAVTPVFVPAAAGSLFGRVCAANPLSWLFDGIRAAAYGAHGSPIAAGIGLVIGLLLLFVGWMFCRIARPHVVERMLG